MLCSRQGKHDPGAHSPSGTEKHGKARRNSCPSWLIYTDWLGSQKQSSEYAGGEGAGGGDCL